MRDAIVRLVSAAKTFASPEGGEVKALDGIDLDIGRNEFITLLGPSGCGKTTLLRRSAGSLRWMPDGSRSTAST